MDELDTPVLDNHLHLDPVNGRGVEAAREFADHGGTHLLVLNKPSWSLLGAVPETVEQFHEVFELTIEVAMGAADVLNGDAWPVLGVHPALISKLTEAGRSPEAAGEFMRAGLDIAAQYVADGPALALKSGRPHYEVEDPVWEASNAVMRHAFELGAETGAAVQLHTEGGEAFTELVEWAEDRGLSRERVVKHYSNGCVRGPIKSVISNKDDLRDAVASEDPFLMETDFIDDPDRPGAVLGPKTVPRRVRWLLQAGHEDAVRTAHVETPARVYGIDTEATLAG